MVPEEAESMDVVVAAKANLSYERAWKQVFDEIKEQDKQRRQTG